MTPKIHTLDTEEWEQYGKAIRAADKPYRCVTQFWDLYVRLFRATPYCLSVDGEPVSFLAIAFNKRAKADGWGKYINSYLVYTRPEHRLLGYSTKLHSHVEQRALSQGYQRTQSLIQTYAGFRFHLGLGHTFWGVNHRGQIRCDSPLDRNTELQGIGVPFAARDVAVNPHKLSVPELIDILSDSNGVYKESRNNLERMFSTHRLAYAPAPYRKSGLC